MNKKLLVTIMSISLLGIACSKKGNHSVDGEGRCTQAYVSDYNNVVHKMESFDSTVKSLSPTKEQLISSVSSANEACNTFYSIHSADITCKAMVIGHPEKGTISSSDLTDVCEAMSKLAGTVNGTQE